MNCRSNICDFTVEDYKISGIAAPYNKLSKDLGSYREVIAPGAFESVLAGNPNVIASIDHSRESDKVLGSTKAGTLQLRSTDAGLEFNLNVAKTSTGADIIELIKRGDLNKMSFAFSVGDETWTPYGNEMIRTIHSFKDLTDISIVVNPAYEDTNVT